MSDRAAELHAALLAADTAPAIVSTLARAVWFNARAGAECPADRIPAPADLGAATFPVAKMEAAVAASAAVVGAPLQLMTAPADAPGAAAPMPGGLALYFAWLPVRTARPDLARSPSTDNATAEVIEAVHAAWTEAHRRNPDPAPPARAPGGRLATARPGAGDGRR